MCRFPSSTTSPRTQCCPMGTSVGTIGQQTPRWWNHTTTTTLPYSFLIAWEGWLQTSICFHCQCHVHWTALVQLFKAPVYSSAYSVLFHYFSWWITNKTWSYNLGAMVVQWLRPVPCTGPNYVGTITVSHEDRNRCSFWNTDGNNDGPSPEI
jgi:hypothetical protein